MISFKTLSRDHAIWPIPRILISTLGVMVLSGCAAVINPSMITSVFIDGVSYATTGKGPADHLISGLIDQDCAMHRGFTDEAVCTPPKDQGILKQAETNSENEQAIIDLAAWETTETARRLGVR